ncbi:MAG: DUF1189 domain-containing protein [Lachnospiraceae bacterium]|nr:DUF1189 domain-containing protein [Lachnospiraceae bacterium]
MNIFKEMILSVYSYKSYKEFLNNKKGKVFGFSLMLMLIYFLVTIGIPFAGFHGTKGIAGKMDEMIPEFELTDGRLWIERDFLYEDMDSYFAVSADPEEVFLSAREIKGFLNNYRNVLLMDSEKIIIKSNNETNEAYYSDLDFEFTKSDLLRWVPYIYVVIAICMLLAFLCMTAFFFLGVIFVALMGMIAASCMNYRLTFGQLYLLGIYSRTLPLIIKAAVSFLPIHIPFFFIFNFGLSLFIIIMAIQKMKEQSLQKPLEFTSDDASNRAFPSGGDAENKNDFSWMK